MTLAPTEMPNKKINTKEVLFAGFSDSRRFAEFFFRDISKILLGYRL
tara:strand:+ start:235 stop:375 length:141 start_codon:yes stop_codon:yes gene_type:complete